MNQASEQFSLPSRSYLKEVWERSKIDIHTMSEDEQLLSFIMNDHEEFTKYWQDFEEWKDHEFAEDEMNPFLHVVMHHLVETQIRNENPPEVEKVFQALKNKGIERQEALHQIGAIFLTHLMQALQNNEDFDTRSYLKELILLPQIS